MGDRWGAAAVRGPGRSLRRRRWVTKPLEVKEYNPPPPERRFMEYLVVRCPRCSMPSAVRLGSLSHTCPYCGTRFKVNEVNIVARARNGREASELVRRMLAQGR